MCLVDHYNLVFQLYLEGFARVCAEQKVVW